MTARIIRLWDIETPVTGYLVGVLFGDGSAYVGAHRGYVSLDAGDEGFVRSTFEALTAVVPSGWARFSGPSKRQMFRAKVSSLVLARLLCDRYGSFGTHEWSAARFLKRKPSAAAIGSMLAGLFDSDGHVGANGARAQIRITSTNRRGLESLLPAVELLGMEAGVVRNGGAVRSWALQFSRADTSAEFVLRCGTANWSKVARVREDLSLVPRDPVRGTALRRNHR